jgi:hypothetical protein
METMGRQATDVKEAVAAAAGGTLTPIPILANLF